MPANVRPVHDERDGLLAYVEQQRDALKHAAHGLDEEQLRQTPTPSALSIGGLLKHCAAMERSWVDILLQRERRGTPEQYAEQFRPGPVDTLESLVADLDAAGRETAEVVAGFDDMGAPVPVPPSPWFPKDVDAWSVRWVLLHLVEELARHAGHADIVREAIDGATAFSLMAAAESWPETPWVTPWRPARDRRDANADAAGAAVP